MLILSFLTVLHKKHSAEHIRLWCCVSSFEGWHPCLVALCMWSHHTSLHHADLQTYRSGQWCLPGTWPPTFLWGELAHLGSLGEAIMLGHWFMSSQSLAAKGRVAKILPILQSMDHFHWLQLPSATLKDVKFVPLCPKCCAAWSSERGTWVVLIKSDWPFFKAANNVSTAVTVVLIWKCGSICCYTRS